MEESYDIFSAFICVSKIETPKHLNLNTLKMLTLLVL
jgi:hypothetical protein